MVAQTVREKKATRGAAVRRIKPSAKMPAGTVLRALSPDELDTLQRLLTEPSETIFHDGFARRKLTRPDLSIIDQTSVKNSLTTDEEGQPTTSQTDVLTVDEERELFWQFNYCRTRVIRILKTHRGTKLTASAARQLLMWEAGAQALRAEIIRMNTSLVLAMARRSKNSVVELGDLVSEGNLALLRCVDKFDFSRGFKFSTYACRAILAAFARASVKASRHRSQFPAVFDPTFEKSDFLERRRESQQKDSVDDLKSILTANAAELTTVERRVLDARFAIGEISSDLNQPRGKTLEQVGDLLGVSKERVRQIQNQALEKLRAIMESRLSLLS
jgi:RNA polymerase primary sigma factor